MIRLDRWLAALAVGSRKEAQQLLRAGQVCVNGEICTDPARHADPARDQLTVRGQRLDGRLMRHVMLYKPSGVLTAARDARARTVMDLLPGVYASLQCMPVGRLDRDTTGLLLLTCDGALAHRLLAPGRHVEKVYRASLNAPLLPWMADAFAEGLDLGDFRAQPALLTLTDDPLCGIVTLREGKYHQVKRMFEAVGREVTALHRERFGDLTLDPDMRPGDWRELRGDEVLALRRAVNMQEDADE